MRQLKTLNGTQMNLNQDSPKEGPKSRLEDKPIEYEFSVASRLSEQWAEWFDGLEISYDDRGNTQISGMVADQAALFGLLTKIRDLNLTLISIIRK